MPDTQSQRLGKYEILAEIGKGGFATVYRAHDPDLGREVALKVLDPLLMRDPAWVARFRQEARVIAALDHPRIVPIYEIGQAEGILFIAMKLLPGGSLADRIKAGPLPWAEVVRLTAEIAEALDFAHGRQVLHRDLKPANVLLDADGHAVLTDFGFARLVADHSLSVSISGGGVVGTPAYIAPEVWEGEPPGSPADLYALGCIVYEMASGVQPFGGATTPAVMRAHFQPLVLPERWPAGTPPGLGDVLRTALAQAPADRYAQAGDLAEAVANLTVDTLAEPYATLQAAVAAGTWHQALGLAAQIREQKPNYRDVVALETQALAGQERAVRVEQAATWRAEAEAALAQGDRSAATLAARQWATLTPNDPALMEFQALAKSTSRDAAKPASPRPPTHRRFLLWGAVGMVVLALLLIVVLRPPIISPPPDNTPTIVSQATTPATSRPSASPSALPTNTKTPQPPDTAARTVTLAPTASPTGTPETTPTATPSPTRTSTPTVPIGTPVTPTVIAIPTAARAMPTLLPSILLWDPSNLDVANGEIRFFWQPISLAASQGYALLVWPDNGQFDGQKGFELPSVYNFCWRPYRESSYTFPTAGLNNAPWTGPDRYNWTVVVVDTVLKDASGRCVIVSEQSSPERFVYQPPSTAIPTPSCTGPGCK